MEMKEHISVFLVKLAVQYLNISISIGCIACSNIHGPLRMKPTDFGDPPSITSRFIFVIFSEMSGWIAKKFGTEIHVPLAMNCNNFGDTL